MRQSLLSGDCRLSTLFMVVILSLIRPIRPHMILITAYVREALNASDDLCPSFPTPASIHGAAINKEEPEADYRC